jgi:hypothetical protein
MFETINYRHSVLPLVVYLLPEAQRNLTLLIKQPIACNNQIVHIPLFYLDFF